MRLVAKLAAAVVGVLMGVSPSPAAAHGPPTWTSPGNGAVLEASPANVRMKFNEVVLKADLLVFAPDGTRVQTGDVLMDGPAISARITSPKQRGRWTVAYRVATADGYTTANVISFSTSSGTKVKQVNPTAPGFVVTPAPTPSTNITWAVLAVIAGLIPVVIMVILNARSDARRLTRR